MQKFFKTALVLLFSAAFVIPAVPAADKYDDWLKKEVNMLINDDEKTEFKNLKTDEEREHFIALFWARRDPTPYTKKNEFKDEYYRRLAYANKMFTHAGIPGAERVHGRTYIIFGAPKRREPGRWVYDPIPDWGLPTKFKIQFKPLPEGYGLDTHSTPAKVIKVIRTFKELTLFNPDLTELPEYGKVPAIDASSSEGQILEAFAAEESEHLDFPFTCRPYFKKIMGDKTYVVFYYDVDKKADMKTSVCFGRLKTADGESEDFIEDTDVEKTGKNLRSIITAHFKPDTYTAYIGIRNPETSQYAIHKQDITVPNFWNEKLALSSIVLTDNVKKGARLADGEFVFGDQQAFPKADNVFKKSDTLYIFYEIYNAQKKEDKVSLNEIIQLESPARAFQIPERPYEETVSEKQSIFLWSSIPVSYLPAGEYKMTINVMDRISGQKTKQIINFKVVE